MTIRTALPVASLLVRVVTIANAQVITLPTATVTLVPAPGSGYRIVPLSVSLSANFAAGAYANIDPDAWINAVFNTATSYAMSFIPNDATITQVPPPGSLGAGAAGTTLFSLLMNATHKVTSLVPLTLTEDVDGWGPIPPMWAVAKQDNLALVLACDNQGLLDFTGGHANNTLKVTTYYVVEAL